MGITTASMVDELKKLSSVEKLDIIGALWDAIPDEDVPVPEEVIHELKRREREMEEHPGRGIPWETLKGELRNR